MQKKLVILIGIILLSSSKKCKETESDKLCTADIQPAANSLRLDGYYYNLYNPPYRDIMFFYKNGVMLRGGAISNDQLSEFEARFSNGHFYASVKENLMSWGNFRIVNNKFFFERWYPSTNILNAYVREGELLNDTTFHISRFYRCDGSQDTRIDDTWHFKKFGPKPDSTNQFIP